MKFASITGKVSSARNQVYKCVVAFVEHQVGQRDPANGVVLPEICNYCVEHKIGFVLTYVPGTGYDLQPLPVDEKETVSHRID